MPDAFREHYFASDGRPRRTEIVVLDQQGRVAERYICVGDHTPERMAPCEHAQHIHDELYRDVGEAP